MNHFKELRSSILGQYDLISKVVLFPSRHPSEPAVGYTQLHEESHVKAMSSTVTGVVQSLLAFVTKLDAGSVPDAVKATAERALDASIEASWFTHEGFAVLRERELGQALGVATPMAGLPADYQSAVALYDKIVSRDDIWIRVILGACVMEACLNTPLLSAISAADLLTGERTSRALEDPGNRPDDRLKKIAAIPTSAFSSVIDASLTRSVSAGLIPAGATSQDVDELFIAFIRSPGGPRRMLWSRLRAIIDDEFYSILQAAGFDNRIIAPDEAQQIIAQFSADIGDVMTSGFGITTPKFIRADFYETSVATDRVEHGPSRLSSVEVIKAEYVQAAIGALSDQGFWFGVHLLGTPTEPLALSVALLKESASESAANELVLRYGRERVLIPGNSAELRIAARLLHPRTVVRTVAGPVSYHGKWTMRAGVTDVFSGDGAQVVALFPTTVSTDVRAFLRIARAEGATVAAAVSPNERLVYLLLCGVDGAKTLVKATRILLSLISQFEEDLWSWVGDRGGWSTEAAGALRLLSSLDDNGAFVSESSDELTI